MTQNCGSPVIRRSGARTLVLQPFRTPLKELIQKQGQHRDVRVCGNSNFDNHSEFLFLKNDQYIEQNSLPAMRKQPSLGISWKFYVFHVLH